MSSKLSEMVQAVSNRSTASTNTTTTEQPTTSVAANVDETKTETNTEVGKQPEQTPGRQIGIDEAIGIYMKKNPLKIYIGTPCYGGNLHMGYFNSVMELNTNFTKLGVPFVMSVIGSESLIPRARNGIVARFMADPDATHLMFIDADITFPWQAVLKLVLMNCDISGGCYPKKMINWDKVKHNLLQDKDMADGILMAKSLDYVYNPVYQVINGQTVAHVQNNMCKVKDLGTGFMMIKRDVFDVMMFQYKDLKYQNNVAGYHVAGADDYFYSLFDTEICPRSRVYLSEDYLFCQRWRDCGGNCFLDLSISLNHTGSLDFRGCLALNIGQVDTLNKDYQTTKNSREAMAAKDAATAATATTATTAGTAGTAATAGTAGTAGTIDL